jgi:transglutaminase-like putative cysteine protease
VSGASVERYYHYFQRVDNTAGLDDLSQLRFYFEPSYQQLTIHFVRVQRGSTVIDSFEPSEVKMIQEEDELDQQLYNGTNAAVIFVNDIRVGDVIEYAYTISGDNPVLGGRFTDTIYLADSDPIQEWFLRLVYPTKRTLAIKNDNSQLEPTKQTIGDDTEYTWYTKNIPAATSDDSTPDWYNPYPRLNLSEFQSWADVVNWALPFYQNAQLNNAELRQKIEEWKKASESPAQRAVTALRFVQDEIRYLGIELGRYSHQPTPPQKVFTRRFGDCKDKSLLLSSILNSMGIEAAPALVNSTEKSSLDTWQPTPFAFDHVIVKATINGRTYWLDPTISYQRGTLDNYYDPPFERSLVLKAGTTGLEKIPPPASNAGSIDVLEVYSGQDSQSAVTFNVTKTYRGMQADAMRYSLQSTSLSDLSKSHLNYYADTTPSISADGLPQVDDNQNTNTIVTREKYLISELWRDNRHSFVADRIYAELQKPRVSQRSTPLEVEYPLSIQQTILINLGPGYDFPIVSDVLTDDALRFEYSYSKSGNQLSMFFLLKTFADSVSTNALKNHLQILDMAQTVVGFELSRGRSAVVVADRRPPSRLLLAITWLVILIPVVFFLVWLVRSRTSKVKRTQLVEQLKAQPGTSPETALQLSTRDQMESMLVNFSCRCGGRPYNPEAPAKRERFTYDGQRLVGIRLVCGACKQASDVYVNPLFENQPEGVATLETS